MPKSSIQSPGRSLGTPNTQRSSNYTLRKSKMSRSVGSPAQKHTSFKLSTVVSLFKENDIPSFNLSVDSVLSDNTQIEQPKRPSWWKRVQDTSRSILEVIENNKINDRENNDIIQEYVDVDVLSQEKRNQSFDLPDSSDNDSYRSIVVPQRKLFSQQQRLATEINYQQLQTQRESSETNNTVIDVKEISVSRRKLLNQGTRRTKIEFPAALLNLSTNKSANNKTKELPNVEIETQTRNLFGNKEAIKRKNIFANFVLSDSEDEMPEVKPQVFAFKKPSESNCRNSWKLQSSPASSTTTDLEMDEWKHLPSSTMVENQLEEILTSPVKRARLSKLSEEKGSNSFSNKSKPSFRSLRSNTSRQSNKNDSKINEEHNSKNQLSRSSRRSNNSKSKTVIEQNQSNKNEPNLEQNIENINNNEGIEIDKLTSIDQIDVPEINDDNHEEEVSSDNVSLQYVEEQINEDIEEEECDEKELDSEEEINNVDEVAGNQSSTEENEDEQEIDSNLDDVEEMEHVSLHEIDQIEGDEDEKIEKENNQYADDENEHNNLNENEQEINKEIDDDEKKEEHLIAQTEIGEIEDENNEMNEENREIQDEIGVMIEREEVRDLQEIEDDQIDGDDGDNLFEEEQETNKEINHMNAIEKQASLQEIDSIDINGDEINYPNEEEHETLKEIDDIDEIQEEDVSLQENRSAEAALCEKRNMKSLTIPINKRSLTPILEPQRASTRYSSDLRDSSGAGSGWDSHRVTRKTLRLTLGKDFSPRKSLRTMVMEKSVKRRTAAKPVEEINRHLNNLKTGSNESHEKVAEPSGVSVNDDDISLDLTMESDHEASRIRQERAEYKDWIQKIRQKNLEVARKIEETVRENLARRSKDNVIFKVPSVPIQRNKSETKKPRKLQKAKERVLPAGLPPEFFEDIKYKPPKRFAPRNAPWITKRLYKYLEDKLEPRYDYKARIRAEKLVMLIYEFTKIVRKCPVAASIEDINRLKYEMAKLNIVRTHYDFNNFFDEFMPRGIRTKVIPDILNGLPLPRPDLFSEILLNNSSNR